MNASKVKLIKEMLEDVAKKKGIALSKGEIRRAKKFYKRMPRNQKQQFNVI